MEPEAVVILFLNQTDVYKMSIRRALIFSFIDRYSNLLISIATSMVIARLLTPGEIGIYSVAMVLVSFAASMRDLGAGQYLVQEPDLTTERIRATWSLQLGIGLGFAIFIFILAFPMALFYEERQLVDILIIIALNFAINPFGSLTYAWLIREMKFDRLTWMRLASAISGALISVGLASSGLGAISLAYGSLASTIVNAMVATYFRPTYFPWRPGLSEIRRVLAFGSRLSGATIIKTVGESAPELILGKIQNLTAAGLYSRANGLAAIFHRLIIDATLTVALPLFSREFRENGGIGSSFIRIISYITCLGWSFFIGLSMLAFPSIRLLYGLQWDASVELARWLCIGLAIGLPATVCPVAMMATGDLRRMLRTTIIATIISIAGTVFGSIFGLRGLGIAFVMTAVINLLIWLFQSHRQLGFQVRELWISVMKSLFVAAITAIGPTVSVLIFGWEPEEIVAPLLLTITLGGLLFIFSVSKINHPIQSEINRIKHNVKSKLRRSK